ncbi:MAG: hypothetical protein GC150_04245 [Rhizobiales bacterium]|nr:hypothetical protein [Hyphomicrobiales bacterium]
MVKRRSAGADAACNRMGRLVGSVMLALLLAGVGQPGGAGAKEAMPKEFVYLRDIDATIIQEMRYFGEHNFVGRRVDGYLAPECILTRKAALALAKVQARLQARNLSLKVYDCYRPMAGVRHFVRWAKDVDDDITKGEFYPEIDKRSLFSLGYISSRSAHARGSTVDLAVVSLPPGPQPDFDPGAQVPCHRPKAERFADNSLDFGTGYDCFHELSHTGNPAIKGTARENRQMLVAEMARVGFKNYRKEWWHYELTDEPFKRTFFDFEILPHPEGSRAPAGDASGAADSMEQLIAKTVGAVPSPRAADGSRLALRFVCVAPDALVELHAEPDANSPVVGVLPVDETEITGIECRGDYSLAKWHSFDLVDRGVFPAPWCLVQPPQGESADEPLRGWVDGTILLESGRPAPECLSLRP